MEIASPYLLETLDALDIVKTFVEKKRRILYGGMAVHLALMGARKDGIYSFVTKDEAKKRAEKAIKREEDDVTLPDYDFYSPDYVNDSCELVDILVKAGFQDVRATPAIHVTTRRVWIRNLVEVADISYAPSSIYDKMKTLNVKFQSSDLLIVHPDNQRLDMLRAMSFPFSNPPSEVILHRINKDIVRFNMLQEAYPVKTEDKEGSAPSSHKINLKLLEGAAICGLNAYAYYCGYYAGLTEVLSNTKRLSGEEKTIRDIFAPVWNNAPPLVPVTKKGFKTIAMFSSEPDTTVKQIQSEFQIEDIGEYNPELDTIPHRFEVKGRGFTFEVYDLNNQYLRVRKGSEGVIYACCTYVLHYLLYKGHKSEYNNLLNIVTYFGKLLDGLREDEVAAIVRLVPFYMSPEYYGTFNIPQHTVKFNLQRKYKKAIIPKSYYPDRGECPPFVESELFHTDGKKLT